ncbi:MAG: DNA polymerase III subunit delta [Oscillospiraceae bacterium]|nr:DNA polymerase III subunit delta [Oscillospiraceae bacterium]
MPAVNEKELRRIIKSKSASGVFCIYGTDTFNVVKYKKELVSSVVAKGDETYNLHEFDGKGINVEGLADACDGLPMFAPAMCVTVCDLDLETEKLSEARLKLLLDTAANLPETTLLIFYTAGVDICGGKKYPTPKNKKLLDIISKNGTVCEIPVKTRAEAIKEIAAQANTLGSPIDERAAALLWERCLGDMNAIMGELFKLASYSGSSLIDTHAVELLTPESNDAKGYNLADAAAAGNMTLALELYNDLIGGQNDPIYLLYILIGSMNDLYRARLAIDYGKGISDVMKDFGYAKNVEFRVKKAFGSARKTSLPRLRRCMEILAKADLDMKSGAGSPEIILEKSITQMLS